MADEKPKTAPTETKLAAPDAGAPLAPPVVVAAKPREDAPPVILEQGEPFATSPVPVKAVGQGGKFKVVHGSVSLGYGPNGPQTAWPGAVLSLNGSDAAAMLAAGTVERVE